MKYSYTPVFRSDGFPKAVVATDENGRSMVYEWREVCTNLSTEAHVFHCSKCETYISHDVKFCPTCGAIAG